MNAPHQTALKVMKKFKTHENKSSLVCSDLINILFFFINYIFSVTLTIQINILYVILELNVNLFYFHDFYVS